MTILVTGFTPFGGLSHNPSQAVLELLPVEIDGVRVRTETLPVDTTRIRVALRASLDPLPRAVIHTGLARDRATVSVERVALNVLDFEEPDLGGQLPRDQAIIPEGPLALPSRLPLRRILRAWEQIALPAELSNSAGTYLCNQLMYLSLHLLPASIATGFIHLPPDETLAAETACAHLTLEHQARALCCAIHETLACDEVVD